jgi:hypothetical protein
MTRSTIGSLGALALAAIGTSACAGKPAAPFDTLKTANLTAYRLQNYEPPSPVPGAAIPGAAGGIPGFPPEIQSWVQQGAGGLQQLLPPGLLPPGMFGGRQQRRCLAVPPPRRAFTAFGSCSKRPCSIPI